MEYQLPAFSIIFGLPDLYAKATFIKRKNIVQKRQSLMVFTYLERLSGVSEVCL